MSPISSFALFRLVSSTKGHTVPGQPGGLQSGPHDGDEGLVGAEGLLAAPEDDGVARLEAESGGIHRDVGPGLVDDADDAQGDPAFADDEAVGAASFG